MEPWSQIVMFPFAPVAALWRDRYQECDVCGLLAAFDQLPTYALVMRRGVQSKRGRATGLVIGGIHAVGIALAWRRYS